MMKIYFITIAIVILCACGNEPKKYYDEKGRIYEVIPIKGTTNSLNPHCSFPP